MDKLTEDMIPLLSQPVALNDSEYEIAASGFWCGAGVGVMIGVIVL